MSNKDKDRTVFSKGEASFTLLSLGLKAAAIFALALFAAGYYFLS